jgi:hypothetical protein
MGDQAMSSHEFAYAGARQLHPIGTELTTPYVQLYSSELTFDNDTYLPAPPPCLPDLSKTDRAATATGS